MVRENLREWESFFTKSHPKVYPYFFSDYQMRNSCFFYNNDWLIVQEFGHKRVLRKFSADLFQSFIKSQVKTILIGTVLLPAFNLVATVNEWKKAELAILNYWFFIGYCILQIELCTLFNKSKTFNPICVSNLCFRYQFTANVFSQIAVNIL